MKCCLVLLIGMLVPPLTWAATRHVESTGYYVRLNEPSWMELNDGREAYPDYRRHITAVDGNGKVESHWCSGTNVVSKEKFEWGGGYCAAFDEDGDTYWMWFRPDGAERFAWKVMGGTGKYEGSSGNGSSTFAKELPDGTTVIRIQGELELRD